MRFIRFFALASFAVSSLCASISDVKVDVGLISDSVDLYGRALSAFPVTVGSATEAQYKSLMAASTKLTLSVRATTILLNSLDKPISQVDGHELVNGLLIIGAKYNNLLDELVKRKAALAALTVTNVPKPVVAVRNDLFNTRPHTEAFASAMGVQLPQSDQLLLNSWYSLTYRIITKQGTTINALDK